MKKIKFDFINEKGFFSIKVSGDLIENSVRSEGNRKMSLVKNTYEAYPENGDFEYISNDSKAICAILCFHPSFPDDEYELDFGFPISEKLAETLKRPYLTPNASYKTCKKIFLDEKSETVISYGGGFDSLAAHCIFPDFRLIHQTPMNEARKTMDDSVNQILPNISSDYGIVRDNMRQLYSVWGLPLWVSVFVPSILFGAKNIISGSELTGTYLEGGRGYHPRYNNLWYKVFKSAGINIYATSFLSEIGNAKVCYNAGVINQAAYCQYIKFIDCGKCTKCLRRRLIKDATFKKDESETLNFEFSKITQDFLESSPLYYGDIFAYCIRNNLNRLPKQLEVINLNSFPNVDFLSKFYPETFNHFSYPNWLEEIARTSLEKYNICEMDEVDIRNLKSYSQNY